MSLFSETGRALRASPKGQTDSREYKMGHLRRDCSLRGARALDKYDLALISHLHTTLNSVMGTHSSTSTPHQCCFLRIFWTLFLKSLLLPPCGFSFNTHSGPERPSYVARPQFSNRTPCSNCRTKCPHSSRAIRTKGERKGEEKGSKHTLASPQSHS